MARRDAETRRNAVIGLSDVIATAGVGAFSSWWGAGALACGGGGDGCDGGGDGGGAAAAGGQGLTPAQLGAAWDTLLVATRDYATDNRGDVGSWVRKAAVEAVERLLQGLCARAAAVEELRALLLAPARGGGCALPPPAAERAWLLLRHEPVTAVGGGGAVFDVAAAQQVSGYGNITGYGAGARLLVGAGRAGAAAARVGGRVDGVQTLGGALLGASVATAWGVGRLVGVRAGGRLAVVQFPPRSLGAACFPYGGAALPWGGVSRAPCGAFGAAVEAAAGADAALGALFPPEAEAARAACAWLVPGAGAPAPLLLPLDALLAEPPLFPLPPAAVLDGVAALLRIVR